MRTRFTLAQLFQRGYNCGDVDLIIKNGFGTYGSKSGAIVLHIADIAGVDEYFNEMAESKRRYR